MHRTAGEIDETKYRPDLPGHYRCPESPKKLKFVSYNGLMYQSLTNNHVQA